MKKLNPPQQRAVNTVEGALLILAGAGSGKTQVITTRIVHFLRDLRVPAENILAVTFTNKAAREMNERVLGMAGGLAKGIVISTFHSLGVRILRRRGRPQRRLAARGGGDPVGLRARLRGAAGRGDRARGRAVLPAIALAVRQG